MNRAGTGLLMAFLGSAAFAAAELGTAEVYSVIEITFTGPNFGAADAPARDVEFWVRFRHEDGTSEVKVHGFWDGDGAGSPSGNVFRVRFCPTKAGKWTLLEVHSNRSELLNEKEGDFVIATASTRKGFWIKDPSSPGGRWYRRSDGSHAYIFGNTHYSFLSERRDTGATGSTIAADINDGSGFFNKLRFSIHGDRYPHPTDKPFLNDSGTPTDDGDFAHRPNPKWWRNRVDLAVKTAFGKDMVADVILAGPDTEDSRATLRASGNGGDNTPYLRYVAARLGSYPNAWFCLCNEYDIKTPTYTNAQINAAGATLRGHLPYPSPVSVHAAPNDWDGGLNTSPPWHDHYILQSKIKDLSDAAENMKANHPRAGGDKPGINDELGYQGAGDGFSEGDIIEGHLGAFLGGGYGSTGEKYGNKLGQYFWGDFNASAHSAADNLLWLRQRIDANVAFWKMQPASPGIFGNTDGGFRAMEWAGNEYVLGTDAARAGVTASLPSGTWQVRRFDVIAKAETTLSTAASGTYAFDAPSSRAVLFHFKKTGGGGTNQPPSCAITSPAGGASFAEGVDIAISASASDPDGTVNKVEFFAGGQLIGTDSTSPYGATWANAPAGSHTITAKATDNGGASTTSSGVSIIVTSGGGGGSNMDFGPEADTYVYQSNPDANYGGAAEISVGGGTTARQAYFRFNVAGLPAGAAVTGARLILACNGSSAESGGTIRKYAPANAQWDEAQPTWNSPLGGTDASGDLASLGAVNAGGAYAFTGLEAAVAGNGRVTFVIRSAFQDGAQYRSKEHSAASERPILRVGYTAGSVTDADGDGLGDSDESRYGYDPVNPDQDGNGLPDGQDDWDGDGVSNQDEAAVGTFPGGVPLPGGDDGGGGGHCGATGAEALLALLLAGARRAASAPRR